MKRLAVALLSTLSLAAASVAVAHPLDPALLELHEQSAGRIDVSFQAPLGGRLEPVLPAGCAAVSPPRVTATPRNVLTRWQVECGADGLVGARLGVDGLAARQTDALVRVAFADGRVVEAVLRADQPSMTIPAFSGVLDVLRDYFRLGLTHILGGPDHLLFVFGLVLLVADRRRLLWTITAFTLGHSATLSLAVLGFVHVPPAPVEVLIALSIVVVAFELTRPHSSGTMPVAMALGFGFLHGLGFAGALAQVGLPDGEIPPALLAFNVGIEVGQLLFVGVALSAIAVARLLPMRWRRSARLAPAYAIGSLASFWVLQRLAAIF